MIDPIPPPSPWLFNAARPISTFLSLPTLPYHVHEVLLASLFYQGIQSLVSPTVSTYLFPRIYPHLNTRTRVNWDVHFVSFVQSCIINTLAIWVMVVDQERKDMTVLERVYGYTGGCGMIQAFATGYFVWDLIVSTRYLRIFGMGILAHAVSALAVFSFGFRPFLNFYGPTFILYELSSPFLNIHWFCDKLNLTGSKIQWYNGMVLLSTFFACRLVWGTYQSVRVYQDVWFVLHRATTGAVESGVSGIMTNATNAAARIFVPRDGQLCLGDVKCVAAQAEVFRFAAHAEAIPVWLTGTYLASNLVLHSLNFYWFGKMIETVKKRFQGKPDEDEYKLERTPSVVIEIVDGLEEDKRLNVGDVNAGAKSSAVENDSRTRKRL